MNGWMPSQISGAPATPTSSIASEKASVCAAGIEDVRVEQVQRVGRQLMRDPGETPHVEVGVVPLRQLRRARSGRAATSSRLRPRAARSATTRWRVHERASRRLHDRCRSGRARAERRDRDAGGLERGADLARESRRIPAYRRADTACRREAPIWRCRRSRPPPASAPSAPRARRRSRCRGSRCPACVATPAMPSGS